MRAPMPFDVLFNLFLLVLTRQYNITANGVEQAIILANDFKSVSIKTNDAIPADVRSDATLTLVLLLMLLNRRRANNNPKAKTKLASIKRTVFP